MGLVTGEVTLTPGIFPVVKLLTLPFTNKIRKPLLGKLAMVMVAEPKAPAEEPENCETWVLVMQMAVVFPAPHCIRPNGVVASKVVEPVLVKVTVEPFTPSGIL